MGAGVVAGWVKVQLFDLEIDFDVDFDGDWIARFHGRFETAADVVMIGIVQQRRAGLGCRDRNCTHSSHGTKAR